MKTYYPITVLPCCKQSVGSILCLSQKRILELFLFISVRKYSSDISLFLYHNDKSALYPQLLFYLKSETYSI